MSVQRSPPCSLPQLNAPINTVHYNSDSALNMTNTSDQAENYFNITKRQKRTFNEHNELTGKPDEIKVILDQIRTQQDTRFEILNKALETIITQNQEIQKSVETLKAKHDDLLLKITNLEHENSDYKKQVSALERSLDQLERKACSSTIEIRNLPKLENENKKALINTIQQLGLTLGLETSIDQSEIRDIFRSRSETLVVDFTTTLRKESIISTYKIYNKCRRENKEPQLNSQFANIPGTPCTVFISDFLTTKARRLFFVARSYVKDKSLSSAWTSYGKIYVKKEEDSVPIRIDNESDLSKLIM